MNRRGFFSIIMGIVGAVYVPSAPWAEPDWLEETLHRIAKTRRDAQFIESRAFTNEEITRWFSLRQYPVVT